MAFWNVVKAVCPAPERCAAIFAAGLCTVLNPLRGEAQTPLLFVTGLPCPGGQGEPTNSHPLIWQCRCASDKDKYHAWWNWEETVPVDYGDVVAVTWFDECRFHEMD